MSIESGTDSTFKREYFPNSNKSLYKTLTCSYKDTLYTFLTYYDIDRTEIDEISTFRDERKYGHHFEFYENGDLKEYCYYIGDKDNSTFIRQYTKDGYLLKEQGNPFVDYTTDYDNRDYELHFSTIFYDTLLVEISSKKMKPQKLVLKKSSMQPMLLEGKFKGINDTYFLSIDAFNIGKEDRKKYNDTLRLTDSSVYP